MSWNPYRRIRELEAEAGEWSKQQARLLDILRSARREADDARTNLARMTESYGQERRDRLIAEAERDELRKVGAAAKRWSGIVTRGRGA